MAGTCTLLGPEGPDLARYEWETNPLDLFLLAITRPAEKVPPVL